jgi:hypothetical protein
MLEWNQSGPEYVATRLLKPHDGKACKSCGTSSAKRKSIKSKKQKAASQGASASVCCEYTETALCTIEAKKEDWFNPDC